MKDMLGRDIVVGNTLAYVDNPYCSPAYPNERKLSLTKVLAVSDFALQLSGSEGPWVVSDTTNFAIVLN